MLRDVPEGAWICKHNNKEGRLGFWLVFDGENPDEKDFDRMIETAQGLKIACGWRKDNGIG